MKYLLLRTLIIDDEQPQRLNIEKMLRLYFSISEKMGSSNTIE